MRSLIRAVIDTSALRENLKTIRERAPGSRVVAVVKANAYGHGLVPTALLLADADALAVARFEEGVALRAAGIKQPVLLLEGVFSSEQLLEAARHRFDLMVHDVSQIELLERSSDPRGFTLWLKIDTGMNRLGFRPSEFHAVLERVRRLQPARLKLRLVTHLARADEPDSSLTEEQVERFTALAGNLGYETSIANSAGIFRASPVRCDWVRSGLALYGVSPFASQVGTALGLRPVMALESTVIATRVVSRGETVGYGGMWKAVRDSAVAIVAAGYADGLPRHLPSGTPVLIAGHRALLVGRVSMDMIAVDISDLPPVKVGAPAMLWGQELPVEEIARHADTIPYELLCGVSQRVPREVR